VTGTASPEKYDKGKVINMIDLKRLGTFLTVGKLWKKPLKQFDRLDIRSGLWRKLEIGLVGAQNKHTNRKGGVVS
jgi:hypothetical protein